MQFNFYDHTKLMVSRGGCVISFIDKRHALHTWSLEHLLRDWKYPTDDKAYMKNVNGVVHKLQYCR